MADWVVLEGDQGKRNTSLAFFTSHERSQLKTHWGSQSTRLSRDSFLPFASCILCLQPSRSPVACSTHGDVFCRECVVSNLLAQKQEIKRLEKDDALRKRDEEEVEEGKREEERERSVRDFERVMMGMEGGAPGGKQNGGGANSAAISPRDNETSKAAGAGTKRKFELDAESILQNTQEERAKARRLIEEEKSSKPHLPAFWVPSLTPSSTTTRKSSSLQKLHPLCPGSETKSPHPLSLKTLITLNFTTSASSTSSAPNTHPSSTISSKHAPSPAGEAAASSASASEQLICPSCAKPLTNTLKALFTIPCGHVLCKPCATKFMTPRPPDPHSTSKPERDEGGKVRCYVCEEDLTTVKGETKEKKKKREGREAGVKRGLMELRSEGTGFAGGGENIARREGVAFQC
ncbi:MAG: hypothetical protein Q9220_003658 [cf. Caloplaca sp. 1 TL-2023]